MITISIGLGLNQLRLHRGENGLALGQAQPNGLGGNHICRPIAGDHFASLNAPGCLVGHFQRSTSSPFRTRKSSEPILISILSAVLAAWVIELAPGIRAKN
jgi:hypothetical protein